MQSLRRRGSLLADALGLATSAGGSRSPTSKNFLTIILDGLTQKTPLLQRSLATPGLRVTPRATLHSRLFCPSM